MDNNAKNKYIKTIKYYNVYEFSLIFCQIIKHHLTLFYFSV